MRCINLVRVRTNLRNTAVVLYFSAIEPVQWMYSEMHGNFPPACCVSLGSEDRHNWFWRMRLVSQFPRLRCPNLALVALDVHPNTPYLVQNVMVVTGGNDGCECFGV